MASLNVAVTRDTLKDLDKLKIELKEKFGFEPSYNKIIRFLINYYKKHRNDM